MLFQYLPLTSSHRQHNIMEKSAAKALTAQTQTLSAAAIAPKNLIAPSNGAATRTQESDECRSADTDGRHVGGGKIVRRLSRLISLYYSTACSALEAEIFQYLDCRIASWFVLSNWSNP